MEQKMLKELKKGEFFTLKPIEEPRENQVWIRGDYDRSAKGYETTRFSDICDSVIRGRGTKVYTGFTF